MKINREYFYTALLLAGFILLFWWRVWIPSPSDRMHFTDDILIKDYPTRMGLYRSVADGYLPLWDPYQFGGWPGIANCEAGFFYPFNWLLLPFVHSPQLAFFMTEWMVFFHFFIAGFGAYCLSRYLGLSRFAAFFAAIAFTFCGFHCAHKKHTNMFFTLVWFPWLLLTLECWLREHKNRYVYRLTGLLCLAYFAGHPQASLYLTLVVFFRMVYGIWVNELGFQGCSKIEIAGKLTTAIIPIALAVGLTSIQWIPTVDLIQQGERAEADVFYRSSEYSLPPIELIEAFIPEALRHLTQIEVFYWGIAPLLLAGLTLFRGPFKPVERFWIGLAIVALLLSLGEHLFAYDLSYLLLPGIAWVRAPSRWIYFLSLPIALLAGREIDSMNFDKRKSDDPALWWLAWLVLGLTVAILIPSAFIYLSSADNKPLQRDILEGFTYFIFFLGIFLILYTLIKLRLIQMKGFMVALVVFTFIDLGTYFRLYDLAPGPGGYTIDDEVNYLTQSTWPFRTKVFFEGGGKRTLYHGAAQNFYELDGNSPLTPSINMQLREDTQIVFPQKMNYTLFREAGVHTFLTDLIDLMPPELTHETQRLGYIDEPVYRARELHDTFHVELDLQRELLSIQSFPFNQVILVSEPWQNDASDAVDVDPGIDFPKPFMLASCSGEAVRKGAYLIVDGENVFSDLGNTPGYYIAVADPQTGAIEEAKSFDVMKGLDDPKRATHHEMIDFIDQIPDGRTVMAVVQDNAGDALLPIGLAALQAIGASVDARGYHPYRPEPPYRLAHAVIGKKGAPVGSALEIISATECFMLQTHRSTYIQGHVVGKPIIDMVSDTAVAHQWNKLLSTIEQTIPVRLQYASSYGPHASSKSFSWNEPLVIYSALKKPDLSLPQDRASIRIGGNEVSLNQKGYNLVVLNPATKQVEKSQSFDLLNDYDAFNFPTLLKEGTPNNTAMRAFIQSVTKGFFILGAVRDEAIDLMQPETLKELNQLGIEFAFNFMDDQARKNVSHAFFAIKGSTDCISIYAKASDSIIFSRYPGGPALTRGDLDIPDLRFIPENPIQEILQSPSARTTQSQPAIPWFVRNDGPNRIVGKGKTDREGILLINEVFFPGWRAFIDNVEAPIERVNYYFRGIRLVPGTHEIEMVYSPPSFIYGCLFSLCSMFLCIVWFIVNTITKKYTYLNSTSSS